MLTGSQTGQTHRFGTALSMASIACRMAGDASSNFKAIFMVQELSFDMPPSILELTPSLTFVDHYRLSGAYPLT
jgi:hypothetical protein